MALRSADVSLMSISHWHPESVFKLAEISRGYSSVYRKMLLWTPEQDRLSHIVGLLKPASGKVYTSGRAEPPVINVVASARPPAGIGFVTDTSDPRFKH
jgi:hypothetical protein